MGALAKILLHHCNFPRKQPTAGVSTIFETTIASYIIHGAYSEYQMVLAYYFSLLFSQPFEEDLNAVNGNAAKCQKAWTYVFIIFSPHCAPL